MKESMPTKYYPRRLTNLSRKKKKERPAYKKKIKNQGLMIKLFTPYELFVGSVNLSENFPESLIGNIFKSNFTTDLCFLPN